MNILTISILLGLISAAISFFFYIKNDDIETKETNRRRKFYNNLKNSDNE